MKQETMFYQLKVIFVSWSQLGVDRIRHNWVNGVWPEPRGKTVWDLWSVLSFVCIRFLAKGQLDSWDLDLLLVIRR